MLRRKRAPIADPAQLHWLADRLDHAHAAAPILPSRTTSDGVITRGTSEPRHAVPRLPEPSMNNSAQAGTREPGIETCTNEIEPSTNEPTLRNCTNEFAGDTNEPSHAVPPLPTSCVGERAARSLDRRQRRRLAALTRRAA